MPATPEFTGIAGEIGKVEIERQFEAKQFGDAPRNVSDQRFAVIAVAGLEEPAGALQPHLARNYIAHIPTVELRQTDDQRSLRVHRPADDTLRGLDERRPGLLFDGANPERAVGPHAGEDDPDGSLLLVLGERAEEEVDGEVQAPRRGLRQQVEHAV